jgi:hypothetical protein
MEQLHWRLDEDEDDDFEDPDDDSEDDDEEDDEDDDEEEEEVWQVSARVCLTLTRGLAYTGRAHTIHDSRWPSDR